MGRTLNTIVKVLLLLGMASGVFFAVVVFKFYLPNADETFRLDGKPAFFTMAAGILAMLCILGAEYIAVTLYRMMRSVGKDPFVPRNVRALRNMGLTALLVMAFGLLTLLLHPVPLAVLAALPVGMCGLFSLVLSNVFEKAVAFKQENDLTV